MYCRPMKIYIYLDSGFWNIARHDFVYMSAMNIFFFLVLLQESLLNYTHAENVSP